LGVFPQVLCFVGVEWGYFDVTVFVSVDWRESGGRGGVGRSALGLQNQYME
jgi:hypothetical protein